MIQDCPGGLRVKAGRAHMERVIILHACPIMPLHFVSPCLCATTAAAAAAAALRRWTCKLKFCSRAAVCSCSLTVNTLRQVNGCRVAQICVQSWIICLCHANFLGSLSFVPSRWKKCPSVRMCIPSKISVNNCW